MPNLKSNFMIFWKEFLLWKKKASLLPTIFAPSRRMIGRQRGTRTSPVESFVLLLTFLSTTSTFILEALFFSRLLVHQWAPIVHLCWLISSFIPSSMISWSKQIHTDLTKAIQFSDTFQNIDDLFSTNNVVIANYISTIYPSELQLKDTSISSTEVCYLDMNVNMGDINCHLVSSVGRAPVCCAGGRWFEPQTGPTLRVLK